MWMVVDQVANLADIAHGDQAPVVDQHDTGRDDLNLVENMT